jgi:multiple sugar transport system substrate-binding protein
LKKTISRRKFVVAITTPAILALTGCKDDEGEHREQADIKVLYFQDPPESKFISEELQQFQQEYNISVRFKPMDYDSLKNEIDNSFNESNKKHYDVMFVDDIWLREFADSGRLMELSDYVERDEDINEFNKDYSDAILRAEAYYPPPGEINSKLYLIPHRADVQVLFYNKAIFEDVTISKAFKEKTKHELTVPETWDEYVTTAIGLTGIPYKDGSIIGCAETLKAPHFAFEFFACRYWSMADEGHDLFEKESNQGDKPLFASPAGMTAIRHFQELLSAGAMASESLTASHEKTIKVFGNGKVALCPQWYTFYSTLKSSVSDLGIALLPGVRKQNGDILRTPSIGGGSFGLPSNARNPKLGWAFIKYFTDKKFSESSARRGAVVPRNSAYLDPGVKSVIPALDIYRKSLQLSRFRPRVAQFQQVESIIGYAVYQAIQAPYTQTQAFLEEAASKAYGLTKKQ